jgi:hypothetical protein
MIEVTIIRSWPTFKNVTDLLQENFEYVRNKRKCKKAVQV